MGVRHMAESQGASCLAVDLGVSAGRVVLATLAGGRLSAREVHRLDNIPVKRGHTLYWDFEKLWTDVCAGIAAGASEGLRRGSPVRTIGIDSWGADFALLDAERRLITPPVHHRDGRTAGLMEEVFDHVATREEIHGETGVHFLPGNTLYQMAALRKYHPGRLSRAWYFLMIPDLLHFRLTGKAVNEYTNATTTQLFNPRTGDWANGIIARLHVPRRIFTIPIRPGTIAGPLLPAHARALNAPGVEVVAVGTHDTASAVAAMPAGEEDFAYLSCGARFLLGTELPEPLINGEALRLSFTNAGGVMGRTLFFRSFMGLGLLRELRRAWEEGGRHLSCGDIGAMARKGEPLRSLIDPDDQRFHSPGDISARVREYCRETNQPVPQSDAALVRCVLESLALKCRHVLDLLEGLTGRRFSRLHLAGDGVRNGAFCQMTADAIGRPVVAGPVEAAALGNAGVQFIARGHLDGLRGLRAAVAASVEPVTYEPMERERWEAKSVYFRTLLE